VLAVPEAADKHTILVVDDNAAATALYERVIAKIPKCVAACRMPGVDGLDFIRRFRLLPGRSAIPCAVLTAAKDPAIRSQALQLGVVDFLTKPVNPERLLAHIKRALKTAGGFP